ncbi:hypothetical protein CLV24_1272 [Pontibacter ummariensis]|uniref:Uncharacterized protein n=2 Tax=Pontibacter ummariensis TaxID=1610492 RepID=A0A239KEY5_9BACT|nr:hypothetical protein CLV24_1272 [Pontibacter ummariensis]SNT16258.1 hypothetical protein SAMN06296052_1282 [Pontibacter ummariensis]
MMVLINPEFVGESPFAFVPALIHEAIHQDPTVGLQEERTAKTFEALTALLQIKYHPEVVNRHTRLSGYNNEVSLAMFNSGVEPRMHIINKTGSGNVFPQSQKHRESFLDYVDGIYSSAPAIASPGNLILQQYIQEFLETNALPCSPAEFNEELLNCLDSELGFV